MTLADTQGRQVWCADVSRPQAFAKETAEDRDDIKTGGAARLMRRRLLRAKLAATWSVHPDAIRFHRDAAGQVCVRAPRAGFVSATQRGDMVALAVSNQPIGVDLEPNGSVLAQDIDAICPNWPALDPTTRWTAFEAFGKLVGRGLTVETNDLAAQEWTDHGLRLTWRGRKVRIDFFDYKEHRLAVAEFEA